MDFRSLTYVLEIAEKRSFSRAADSLYLSQPSLSNYISRLENQLGLKLFDRTTTPIKLTPEGECYVKMAESILEIKDGFLREIQDIKNMEGGNLTLGISNLRAAILLPKILPLFKQRFPNVNIIIKETETVELEELAIKGKTDVAIMTAPIRAENLVLEPIMKERVYLAFSSDHHFFKSNAIDQDNRTAVTTDKFKLLNNESFLLMPKGLKLRQTAESFFDIIGIAPRIGYETTNIVIMVELVKAGVGITFVPESFLRFYQTDSLIFVSLDGIVPSPDLGFVYKKGRYLTHAAQEFMKLAREEILKKRPSKNLQ